MEQAIHNPDEKQCLVLPKENEVADKAEWNKELADKAEEARETKKEAKARREAIKEAQALLEKAFDNNMTVEADDIEELVNAMPEEHAELLDQAEVRNGERRAVVIGKYETFQNACARLKIPLELREAVPRNSVARRILR